MFWLSGIPNEIEGEAATEMFNWLLSPKEIVSPHRTSRPWQGKLEKH